MNRRLYAILLTLCVTMMIPARAVAAQCAALLPSAAQNFTVDGSISLGDSVQIIGDPDRILETLNLSQTGVLPGCGDQDCIAGGAPSAAFTIPAITPGTSSRDIAPPEVVGADGETEFRRAYTVGPSPLVFSDQQNSYRLALIRAYNGGHVNLVPGDYYVDDIQVVRARLNIVGDGLVRIFVANSASFAFASINATGPQGGGNIAGPGDASRLLIVSHGGVLIRDSVLSGAVYADQPINLAGPTARVYGALAAPVINIDSGARLVYDAAARAAAQAGGLCTVGGNDLDGDGIPDELDSDRDGDGIDNDLEVQAGFDPDDVNSTPPDLDGDGLPDSLDSDRDGDGIDNDLEVQAGFDPDDASSTPPDLDGDGLPDSLDADRDGDGVDNDSDSYPDDPGASAPAAVSGLAAVTETGGIRLDWDAHPEPIVVAYRLERSPFGSGDWQALSNGSTTSTTVFDDAVSNGAAYSYRVLAIDDRDIESPPSTVVDHFYAFNSRELPGLGVAWSDFQATIEWQAPVADERVRIYRGDAIADNIVYDADGIAFADPASHWASGQRYQVASVRVFDNPITGIPEDSQGPLIELLLPALPTIEIEIEDAEALDADSWRIDTPAGLSLSLVGAVDNALGETRVRISGTGLSLSTVVADGRFQFLLRDVVHQELLLEVEEEGAPDDRRRTYTVQLAADETPLSVIIDAPGDVASADQNFEISGRIDNAADGISRLSARSDRYAGITIGLTLLENQRFAGEVPLEFGDNLIEVEVTDGAGAVVSASISVERPPGTVPSIQVTSHVKDQVVTTRNITLEGRLYSSLPASQIQLDIEGESVDPVALQASVYGFTLADMTLESGFNRIVLTARTPFGDSRATLELYYQDTVSDIDAPLQLELSAPVEGRMINDEVLVVRGRLLNAASSAQLRVNGSPVSLFGSAASGWVFNAGIDISAFAEGVLDILVEAESEGKAPVSTARQIVIDRLPPEIVLDNALSSPPTVNTVNRDPYLLSGSVTESNLASLQVNGQPLAISPGSGADNYLFAAPLSLPRGETTGLSLVAYDRAGNSTRLVFDLFSDPAAVLEVIQPLDDTEYVIFGGAQTIDTVTRVDNAPADARLSIEAGTASVEVAVDQRFLSASLTVVADPEIDEIRFRLLDGAGEVLASQTVSVDIVDGDNLPLELLRHSPQQGDAHREPHHPVQFVFNRPVDLADLQVEVRETVHGPSYSSERTPGGGLGSLYQGAVIELHRDQAPVAGGLSLLPGARIVEFYPDSDISYGARVFVDLEHLGEPLARFFYDVRANPTFVKLGLFDQAGQAIPGIGVELPELGFSGTTDNNGVLMLGGGAPADLEVVTGLYRLLLNPRQANPAYGTRELQARIEAGRVNDLSSLRLPQLSRGVAYRELASGKADNRLVGGDLLIDTQAARLIFPDGRDRGLVHVQVADYSDGVYSAGDVALAPLWMFDLQPGPIRVEGEIELDIGMPALYGGYGYIPESGTRVVLMGLDPDSGLVEPIGVGRIEGTRVLSEGRVVTRRLDLVGYQFLGAEAQSLAREYGESLIGLDALRQGILQQ